LYLRVANLVENLPRLLARIDNVLFAQQSQMLRNAVLWLMK
jgi:hypothetical protein